ncbi:DUF6544 family protein [Catalinimonas niigatensis]|uniref:DUF6544 family protein n=1 Tax=Catalinimonas niigatensis TaxID=1397264 RepID=UPI0026662A67|nr:DUF6544 family protein [Catalinimonas niigatensis]WPP48446.1 DUF6544 family protein [Catalinimonas niigatensis]
MKYLFVLIVLIHGIIHLLGFVKAFQLAEVSQLTQHISKPTAVLWLAVAALFLLTALLYMAAKPYWVIIAFVSVLLSQVLIFMAWQDAKFGTIANLIILLVAIVSYGAWQFENSFRRDVAQGFQRNTISESELLTENDLQHLPAPVQKYLRYVGVVGKPKVKNVRIEFSGEMREKGKNWFAFTSQQYNFYDDPERLFFMKARVKGLPTSGYHAYKNGQAGMLIKVLSLFPVVNIQGEELLKAETVTIFNDMCLFAPAALIDPRIQWEAIDDTTTRATFHNRGVSISATLYFNEEGQLINFISDDRYAVADMQRYRFSTPLSNYQMINGYRLGTYGEAIWHYPDGEFAYGKFSLKHVEYNVEEQKK